MSVKAKQQMFIDMRNYEIGEPFYSHEKSGMKEIIISEKLSEYIQDPIPVSGCGIAWEVDTTKRGLYLHPTNGITFQIEGFKKSWHFTGNPENCQTSVNWFGPW